MDNLSRRILLVEDNEDDYIIVRDLLCDIATTQFDLDWADTYQAARQSLARHQYDACLLDYRLGETSGVELLREFAGSEVPFILLTGEEDYDVDVAAAQAGAADYLVKGFIDAPLIERSIRYAIERKKTEASLSQAQLFAQATVDALPHSIAVLDGEGTIVAVNAAWREYGALTGFADAANGLGANYLEVCDRSNTSEAREAAEGIRAVIAGRRGAFCLEYPCHSPSEQRWFQMGATRFSGIGPTHIVVAHENITQRKATEQRLQMHAHLLSIVGQAVIVTDRTGSITYWNQFAEKLYGWAAAETLGCNILDVVSNQSTRTQATDIMACLARGEDWSGEFVAQKRDGSTFPAYVTNSPVLNEAGHVTGIIGLSHDISERKIAEKALQTSEQEQRQLAERLEKEKARLAEAQTVAKVGSWELDLSTDELTWSDENYRIFGVDRNTHEASRELFLQCIHPDDRAAVNKAYSESVANHTPYEIDHRLQMKDGSLKIVHERCQTYYDDLGRPIRSVGTTQDITEQRQAEESLRQSNELLRAVTEGTSDAIFAKDKDGRYLMINSAGARFMGRSAEEIVGQTDAQLIPLQNAQTFMQSDRRIMEGGIVQTQEETVVLDEAMLIHEVAAQTGATENGVTPLQSTLKAATRTYLSTKGPLRGPDGDVVGMVGISSDITERKQAEAALRWSEVRYRSLIKATTAIVWNTPASGQFELEQPEWSAFTGQTWEQLKGSGWLNAIHPDDQTETARVWRAAVEGRTQYDVEHRLLRYDGQYRHMAVRGVPLLSADGLIQEWIGVHTDITERKQTEAALSYSEERYRSLVLTTTQIVWTTPADGMVNDMPSWRNFTGQSRKEVQGWGWTKALHPDDLKATRDIWLRCLETKSHYDTEYRIRAADGHYRLFAVRGVPVLESDGSIREWVGTCADITDRKKAEEERDRFFTLSLDMLAIIGNDGYMKRLNPAFETTLGFSNAELMAVPFLKFVHPDDHGATLAEMAKLESGALNSQFENRYRCRDGSYKWLRWMCAPFEDLWYCVAHDITSVRQAAADLHEANDNLELRVAQRTAELHAVNQSLQAEIFERRAALDALQQVAEAFRATQERLQSVTNHIPQAIFWKDRQSIYLGCNNRMAADAGLDSPNEIVGKNDFDLSWAEHAAAYRADDAQVMDTDTPKLNIEEPLIRADGARIWLRTNKVPLHDNEGAVVGVLASYEDITLQKEAEAAIHQAREEAEAAREEAETANLAKSEFLSRMSHELRTPLNAILGFGQILEMRAGTSDPKLHESIRQILKAGRHLLSLINEVLDIARIEAGHLSLSLEPICAGIVVQESLDLVRPLATDRHIHLVNEVVGEDAGRHLLADQQRLKQVMLNLLANAVKYNREGGSVFVGCEIISHAPITRDGIQHEGHLRFLVRDTGGGLSSEDISKLFMPFERLEAARSQIEGTGIGLTLCKRLVEAMNGEIGVESEVGKGSTFWVKLPLVISPLQRIAQLEAEQLAAVSSAEVLGTILYIEDNLSNISLVEHALSGQSYAVKFLTAMQGSVGLELAAQHLPDLILLDVHLPDIMGDVVLRHLKENAATRDIPVVVLSADATPSQIERLLSGGAEAYLTKPLDLKQFFGVVEPFLKAAAAGCKDSAPCVGS